MILEAFPQQIRARGIFGENLGMEEVNDLGFRQVMADPKTLSNFARAPKKG